MESDAIVLEDFVFDPADRFLATDFFLTVGFLTVGFLAVGFLVLAAFDFLVDLTFLVDVAFFADDRVDFADFVLATVVFFFLATAGPNRSRINVTYCQ